MAVIIKLAKFVIAALRQLLTATPLNWLNWKPFRRYGRQALVKYNVMDFKVTVAGGNSLHCCPVTVRATYGSSWIASRWDFGWYLRRPEVVPISFAFAGLTSVIEGTLFARQWQAYKILPSSSWKWFLKTDCDQGPKRWNCFQLTTERVVQSLCFLVLEPSSSMLCNISYGCPKLTPPKLPLTDGGNWCFLVVSFFEQIYKIECNG